MSEQIEQVKRILNDFANKVIGIERANRPRGYDLPITISIDPTIDWAVWEIQRAIPLKPTPMRRVGRDRRKSQVCPLEGCGRLTATFPSRGITRERRVGHFYCIRIPGLTDPIQVEHTFKERRKIKNRRNDHA